MQRMSRKRSKWQLNVHRLHSLNNVTARGSDQESPRSRKQPSTHVKKKFLGNIKNVFPILFERRIIQNLFVFEKQFFISVEQKHLQKKLSFSKRMDKKTREKQGQFTHKNF